jgi:hypothetical protein
MRSSLRLVLAPVLVAALLVAPRIAHACSVCTGGQKEEVGTAFLVGSLFLSVLPLAAIGAVAWWLRRRSRALADAATALSAASR